MANYISKINVQYASGTKARGVRVCLSFKSFWSGVTKSYFTDKHGVVLIEHASKGEADVIVNGKTRGNFHAPSETVVFI